MPRCERTSRLVTALSRSSAEHPSLDVDRLFSALAHHEVHYRLVGGVATRLYGARRLTEDLGCVAHQTRANLARLCAAVKELGADLRVAA